MPGISRFNGIEDIKRCPPPSQEPMQNNRNTETSFASIPRPALRSELAIQKSRGRQ